MQCHYVMLQKSGDFMKYSVNRLVFACGVMVLCAGCGRVIEWGKDVFYQGIELKDETERARSFIRSVTIYDQLSTDIMVDALWLSDEVRTAYVKLHARLHCFTDERMRALLRRQFEENKHFIVFYVLVPRSVALDDEHVGWGLSLCVGDVQEGPIEVKLIDLGPEYEDILGKVLTRFKAVYQVKFEALDAEDKPLVTPQTTSFSLYVRSTKKEAVLVWPVAEVALSETVCACEE